MTAVALDELPPLTDAEVEIIDLPVMSFGAELIAALSAYPYARFMAIRDIEPSRVLMADISPATPGGLWHLCATSRRLVGYTSPEPVATEDVIVGLRRLGLESGLFMASPAEPCETNPWRRVFARSLNSAESGDGRYVYFIQAETGGPIKIGVAGDPQARLAAIQHMSPVRLCILGVIPEIGGPGERQLHRHFAEIRSHGEWFHPTAELMAHIQESSIPLAVRELRFKPTP